MNKVSAFFVSLLFFALSALPALAAPKDDAIALVDKAVVHVNSVGKDKALADFQDAKGAFVKGDLYVFAYTLEGVIIAHPMNQKLVGKDMTEVKDSDGKFFTKDFIATVKGPGKGWVDYNWTNPTSKKIEAKSSYVAKAGDIFVGCGIYK
jgi:cytochrome c